MRKEVTIGLFSFYDYFYCALNAELDSCKKNLKQISKGANYAIHPSTLLRTIDSNLRILKKMNSVIHESQEILSEARIKTVAAHKKAEAAAIYK